MRKLLDKVYRKCNKKRNKKKEADILWAKLIKLRAGNKSELSGKTDRLNAHHLAGKSCLALRYSLLNGFSCTAGEHIFGFHHTGRMKSYRNKVKALRGKNIYEKLEKMKQEKSKPIDYYIGFLEAELQKYETNTKGQ